MDKTLAIGNVQISYKPTINYSDDNYNPVSRTISDRDQINGIHTLSQISPNLISTDLPDDMRTKITEECTGIYRSAGSKNDEEIKEQVAQACQLINILYHLYELFVKTGNEGSIFILHLRLSTSLLKLSTLPTTNRSIFFNILEANIHPEYSTLICGELIKSDPQKHVDLKLYHVH